MALLNSLPPNTPLLTKSGFLATEWYRFFVSLVTSTSAAQAGQVLTPSGGGLEGGGNVSDGLSIGIAPNGVSNSQLAQMPPMSVKGNPYSVTGNATDIQSGADNRTLSQLAGILGFFDYIQLRSGNFGQLIQGSRDVTASTAYTTSDFLISANASGGAVVLTLPTLQNGLTLAAKKLDASANTVTISGAQNIDGAASKVLSTQYSSLRIIGGATEWHVL